MEFFNTIRPKRSVASRWATSGVESSPVRGDGIIPNSSFLETRLRTCRADLAVKRRKKAKRPSNDRQPLRAAQTLNEVWSMDFVSDSLVNGRRLKCLTVADDFSHESIDIPVDYGMSGQYVTRILDQAALFRGYPQAVRTDNGPEFTSRAFMGWCQTHGITHLLIEPVRRCDSFNRAGKTWDGQMCMP